MERPRPIFDRWRLLMFSFLRVTCLKKCVVSKHYNYLYFLGVKLIYLTIRDYVVFKFMISFCIPFFQYLSYDACERANYGMGVILTLMLWLRYWNICLYMARCVFPNALVTFREDFPSINMFSLQRFAIKCFAITCLENHCLDVAYCCKTSFHELFEF